MTFECMMSIAFIGVCVCIAYYMGKRAGEQEGRYDIYQNEHEINRNCIRETEHKLYEMQGQLASLEDLLTSGNDISQK